MARKLFQSRPDPLDMSKYRQVIQIMYPNRTREIYDHMELEYTAFCKNKVSRDSMEEHLIHLLSTDIEPNYLFVSPFFGTVDIDLLKTCIYLRVVSEMSFAI